jgi:hypothetical protein
MDNNAPSKTNIMHSFFIPTSRLFVSSYGILVHEPALFYGV